MEPAAADTGEPSEVSGAVDLGLEMLSAAHVLLSSERLTDEHDLLISTCLELLDAGPAATSTLAHGCNEIWPAAEISMESVRAALEQAAELDLVAATEDLLGENGWCLGVQGKAEINLSRSWLADAMARLARQIQERAREDIGDLPSEVALNWANLLRRICSDEIARSAASYAGEVERGAAGTVRPMSLDGQSMLRSLDARDLPQGTTDFLKACLIAAVDETDPFGNELLGQVATSCVLHAVAARRGRAAAHEALGTLRGMRVVIDTPVLFRLLGADSEERRVRELIEHAVSLGMEVIVPEHVLEEMSDVVQRIGDEHLAGLTAALGKGVSARAYALMVNEELLVMFLDGVRAKRYKTWHDLSTRAFSIAVELRSMGVIVREHGNTSSAQRSNVTWAEQSLIEELASTSGKRGGKAIARDAETIEMVWRARRRMNAGNKRESLWPGGWMVSNDRHSGPTYRRLNARDREPLVLTPAQWATLMAEAAPAAEIDDLIAAAASFVREETMMRIATKYPPAIALTLARTLSGEFTSTTDVRIAQLSSLGEMLEQTADGRTPTGERLASEIASRRSSRLAAAGKEQVDLATLERSRLDAALTRSNAVVDHEQSARAEAEERLREVQTAANEQKVRSNRTLISAVAVTASIGLAVVFAVIGWWAFVAGTAFSIVLLIILSKRWIDHPSVGAGTLWWAALPELLGLYDIGIRLGFL